MLPTNLNLIETACSLKRAGSFFILYDPHHTHYPARVLPFKRGAEMKQQLALRVPIVLGVALALSAALWAALVRVGWKMPALPMPIAGQHGALMVSAFLGTLISLERAVALQKKWAYVAPILSVLGGLALLLDVPPEIGRGLIALGSLGLVIVFGFIYRLHPTTDVVTMALGSVMWLIGNVIWWSGESIYRAAPWWAGFLILTICGERLELSRVLLLKQSSRTMFMMAVGVFSIGLLLSLFSLDLGLRIGGVGLILLGVWLLRFDIARHTIKKAGLTRYIAACLLPGYVWLIIGGSLWLIAGLPSSNLIIDAMLHTLFLGFVFSMIFGHAPIILPALLPVDITYRSIFYAPLVLLQGSLIVRVMADLMLNQTLRQWAGLFNVLAILLFLGVMLLSIRRRGKYVERRSETGAPPQGL